MPEEKPKQGFHQLSTEEREALLRKYMAKGEIRCLYCAKMFFKGILGGGTHIIPKCPRCKEINEITVL